MEENKISLNNIIRHFSPAWYAAVMGTGGLANVIFAFSEKLPILKSVSVGLWILNTLLFILFLGPWIARWFLHFDKIKDDLKHPIMSNFFVTMPIGGLILGTNFFLIGEEYISMSFITSLGMIFWAVAVVMALGFGVFVIYNMIIAEQVGPETTNFSWFITPVASIIIPLLGNQLIKVFAVSNLELAKFINLIDICFYGMGFMLFLIFSSILMNRFISHKMPHAMTTPTFWILLGPIGVGTISLLSIADSSKLLNLISSTDSIKLMALLLWGFGLWAFILIISITIKYIKEGGIPFSLSWWAFIFPLAAYTLASISVYGMMGISALLWYSILLTVLLGVLWFVTFVRSLIGIFNGKLFLPQMPQKKSA